MDNMKGYFDFGVFGYIDSETTDKHYLAMVTKPSQEDTDPDRWGRIMGTPGIGETFVGPQSKKIQEIVMELRSLPIIKTTDLVKTKDDVSLDVSQHIIGKAFDLLIKHADDNGARMNDKFPTGLNLTLKPGIDERQRYRQVISRILAVSNMIAVNHRRGPANFVLMNEEIYRLLFLPKESSGYFYCPDGTLAGLKCFISPVGDRIVVGRGSKEKTDDGIFIQCADPITADYVFEDNEIAGVHANYAIVEAGEMPYMSFRVS